MCGIFGVINMGGPVDVKRGEDIGRLLRALAVHSTARGMDSAGLARLDADGNFETFKDVGAAWELFGTEGWETTARARMNTFAYIGHTRLATHGAVIRENAHPFVFPMDKGGKLIGVHNGVISNHMILPNSGSDKSQVDSANLFLAMAQNADWQRVWRQASGSLAVAVLRTDEPSITIARNHNPVAMAPVGSLKCVVFASTEKILKAALDAVGIRGAKTKELPPYSSLVQKPGGKDCIVAKWASWKEWSHEDAWTQWTGNSTANSAAFHGGANAVKVSRKAAKRAAREQRRKGGAPQRAMVGDIPFARCGSCLEWRPENHTDMVNGTVVCDRCLPYFRRAV